VLQAVEQDPGELKDLDSKTAEWAKAMRKWKREHKRTKANTARALKRE